MEKTYLIALSALLAGCLTVQTPEGKTIVAANATLKDGSSVKGEFTTKRIKGSTAFAKSLAIDAEIVKSVNFTGTNGESKVELKNGDKFAMTVANENFKLKSLLGYLSIARANFRALSLSARKIAANGYDEGLVFYCTFDDEAAITSPAVGPSGIFQNGEFKEGKNGQALYLPAHTSGAKFTIPEGMIGPAGTIEFWGKVSDYGRFSDGGCPRFFQVFSMEPRGEISQDWSANNGSGGSGLTFRIDGLPALNASKPMEYSNYSSSSYRRLQMTPPQGWHHYAIAWDTKGIGPSANCSAAVFMDGQRVLSTPFNPEWQGPVKLSSGATIFFPNREDEMPGYARRAYTIDDFKIWNYAKTEFDL